MDTQNNKIDPIKKYNLVHQVSALDRFKWYIEMLVVRVVLIIVALSLFSLSVYKVLLLYNMCLYIIIFAQTAAG